MSKLATLEKQEAVKWFSWLNHKQLLPEEKKKAIHLVFLLPAARTEADDFRIIPQNGD